MRIGVIAIALTTDPLVLAPFGPEGRRVGSADLCAGRTGEAVDMGEGRGGAGAEEDELDPVVAISLNRHGSAESAIEKRPRGEAYREVEQISTWWGKIDDGRIQATAYWLLCCGEGSQETYDVISRTAKSRKK